MASGVTGRIHANQSAFASGFGIEAAVDFFICCTEARPKIRVYDGVAHMMALNALFKSEANSCGACLVLYYLRFEVFKYLVVSPCSGEVELSSTRSTQSRHRLCPAAPADCCAVCHHSFEREVSSRVASFKPQGLQILRS